MRTRQNGDYEKGNNNEWVISGIRKFTFNYGSRLKGADLLNATTCSIRRGLSSSRFINNVVTSMHERDYCQKIKDTDGQQTLLGGTP